MLRRLALQPARGIPAVLKIAVALIVLVQAFFGLLVVTSGAAALGVYAFYAGQLEGALDELETRQLFETTKIYDRNGYLLYEVFEEGRRTRIERLDQVPDELIWATLSAEDKTFFENPGVDVAGITRAAVLLLLTGEIQGGGSTLTQQFIRNALFPPEERYSPSFERKIKEAILALEMTRSYEKEDILLMYLNEISYGNLAYGIEAAAQGYFGKTALELTLSESAFLAGLPQSPTENNPFYGDGMERAKARQYDILHLMADNGYITEQQANAAYREKLKFARPEIHIEAPHFVMYVLQLLEQDPAIGPEMLRGGGLSVYTSLDMRYQRLAEAVVRDRMLPDPLDPEKNRDMIEYNAHNAALLAMRPDTGEILAMVGSVDYNLIKPSVCGQEDNVVDGNVNTTLSERQPGSSFKPVTYLTAFLKGWSPATMVLDVKTEFPVPGHEPYAPENYTRKWHGPVRLRNALGGSLNMPAVKVIQYAGVPEVIDMAHRLGVKGLNRGAGFYGLSLTLGGGEVSLLDMVTANSTLANEGRYVEPTVILKITDPAGNVLREYKPVPLEEQPEVVDPRYVYLVTNVLSDDGAREIIFGRYSILALSRPTAVKTGTSEDWSDNWTLGFTPYLAVGVWVGNNNNEPMSRNCVPRGQARSGIPGIRSAGRIWNGFMEAIYHPDDENIGLPRYFPDEDMRIAYFGDGDLEDVLRDEEGNLRMNFRRPPGLVEQTVCAISGHLPGPYCPTVTDLFVRGNEPRDVCPVHKAVTVVQLPGTDPPQYCLPLEGVVYPPELLHELVYMDLQSVAKPEELPGLEEWILASGTPQPPTWQCPPDLGTWQPGEPGQPGQPPRNRWAGLRLSISSPRRYQGITGPIEIRGTATLTSTVPQDQFAFYKVEWGQKLPTGAMPEEWYPIGEGYTPVQNGVLTVWDPAFLADGSYLVRLTVVTRAGEEPGHVYVPIYLDRGPIFVRFLYPPPGATLRQTLVTLSVKVEGVSPAARVDFFYDGIFIGSAITDTIMPLSERVYTVTWPVRPGQHVLTAEAVNTAGRRQSSARVLVIGEPPEGMSAPGQGEVAAVPISPAGKTLSPSQRAGEDKRRFVR